MIANFVLMGELYQHNPFDTEAAPWNTYPWHIGADNGLDFETSLLQFAMAKTIWRIDEEPTMQGLSITGATLGDLSMFATLIVMDMWGNLGSDAGKDPESIPPDELIETYTSANIISVESKAAIIVAESNSEQELDIIESYLGANITATDSKLIFIVDDSNSETEVDLIESYVSASITNVSSKVV